jgi:hypothetical protein
MPKWHKGGALRLAEGLLRRYEREAGKTEAEKEEQEGEP